MSRLRWLRSELPFVIVVAIVIAAALFLYVEPGHWRRGTSALAVGVLLAAVFRAALPSHLTGLLNVRNRVFDTVCYLAMGGVVIAVDLRLH